MKTIRIIAIASLAMALLGCDHPNHVVCQVKGVETNSPDFLSISNIVRNASLKIGYVDESTNELVHGIHVFYATPKSLDYAHGVRFCGSNAVIISEGRHMGRSQQHENSISEIWHELTNSFNDRVIPKGTSNCWDSVLLLQSYNTNSGNKIE